MNDLLVLIFGLGAVVLGAESLVRGASRLAAAVGISPLVIGLTIVAYGTSAPELAVSAGAALSGQADLALGNVVGSNIFNVLFILGVSAAIKPLIVAEQLVRWDVWVMIGVSVLALLLGLDQTISRIEGAVLFGGAVAYTAWCIRQGLRDGPQTEGDAGLREPSSGKKTSWIVNAGYLLAGLCLLVAGARWLVEGAVGLARWLGVSELVIGLTIVSAGTSLPEVATSVIATLRGERDIAVGNVVGSNIFNILAVLGLSAAVAPVGVPLPPSALTFDMPLMIGTAAACLPVFFSGYRIDRWEGVFFLFYYAAYIIWLILDATQSPVRGVYRLAALWFVVPITVITLLIIGGRQHRRRSS